MSVIYQTTITRIGQSAKEALGEQMLITFREGRAGGYRRILLHPLSWRTDRRAAAWRAV